MGLEEISKNIIQDFGYIGLVIALAFEFIGLPIPGETIMVFVGFQTTNGNMGFLPSILFAFIGTNIGSYAAYFIGRLLGRNFLLKYGKYVFLDAKKLTVVERWFNRYQAPLYIFGRYIIGIRHFVPYLGGICKTNIKPFTIYNFIGSLLWCASFIAAGNLVGKKWHKIVPLLHEYMVEIIIGSVVILVGYMFLKRFLFKKASNTQK